MSPVNTLKAIIFFLIMFINAWCGLLFAFTPAIPFVFFNRPIYSRWCSSVMGYFLLMITCLLEDLFGIQIVVTGNDLSKDKKRSLIILNHRTRLDWMYIWMLLNRFQILAQLKIVLKASLEHIPGLGWAIQHAGYLFLKRVWGKDQQTIKAMVNYYQSCQAPLSNCIVAFMAGISHTLHDISMEEIFNPCHIDSSCFTFIGFCIRMTRLVRVEGHTCLICFACYFYRKLLIFPEGTNLAEGAKRKSNNYAAKQPTFNRPYEYCLHPHLTGFTYLINTMRADDIIDTVDDVTIGYEGEFPITELDLLKGSFPKVVHFHVKRYNVNDLPKGDEQIGQWLQQCWDEKEDRLKEFYTNYQFDSLSNKFNNQQIESTIAFQRRLAFILWLLFTLFWSYCFIAYLPIKLYVLIVCVFHVILEVFGNGITGFLCQLNGNNRQERVIIKND